MASEPRTIKGPCFDECHRGQISVISPGFLDFYMECGCTYEGPTKPHSKIDLEPEQQRQNVPPRMM